MTVREDLIGFLRFIAPLVITIVLLVVSFAPVLWATIHWYKFWLGVQ